MLTQVKISVSRETHCDFLSHLEGAFLLQTVAVATDSEKRRQVNPRKVYPADPALIPVFDRSGKNEHRPHLGDRRFYRTPVPPRRSRL